MKDDDRNKRLLEITVSLLREYDDPDDITTRMIADRAGVNLALINYYYRSKDELLKQAVNEIVSESSENMYGFKGNGTPKQILHDFIFAISGDLLKYEKYSKIYVPDQLLNDPINIPDKLYPFIRDHFNGRRSDGECRFDAYHITSIFQLIYYRSKDVQNYSGYDIRTDEGRDLLITKILDEILTEG